MYLEALRAMVKCYFLKLGIWMYFQDGEKVL